MNDLKILQEADLPIEISAHVNNSSVTWHAVVGSSQEKRIFVKHHNTREMYENEKNALCQLKKYSSKNEKYAVPAILFYNDIKKLIAIDWIDFSSIAYDLRRSVSIFGSEEDLEKGKIITHAVGCWISKLEQRTFANEFNKPPIIRIRDRIGGITKRIHDKSLYGFSERIVKKIENFAENNLAQIDNTYPVSLVHRDFWFGHIMKTDNDGVLVIDYGRTKKGNIVRDIAQFLLRLRDFKNYNPLVSSEKVKVLESSFLSGLKYVPLETPIMKVYLLLCKLEHLGGLVEQTDSNTLNRTRLKLQALAHLNVLRNDLLLE